MENKKLLLRVIAKSALLILYVIGFVGLMRMWF